MDSDMSSDKTPHMINFIRPLFAELREYIHKYNFQDNEEKVLRMLSNMVLILIASALLPAAFPALALQFAGFISIWVLNCGIIWSMVMRTMIGTLPFFLAAFRFTKNKSSKVILIISFSKLQNYFY